MLGFSVVVIADDKVVFKSESVRNPSKPAFPYPFDLDVLNSVPTVSPEISNELVP